MANHFTIPFQETGYFTKTMCDYLDKKDMLKPFYNNFPDLNGFENQIKQKSKKFSKSTRKILVSSLAKQYKGFDISTKTKRNIDLLKSETTFTVTTGHQLNLFTGPLYFLHKIVSTINLSVKLKEEFSDFNFVPIYWMATEDHDFEEIQFFNYKNKKIVWNRDSKGAVGRLNNDGLDIVLKEFSAQLGKSKHAKHLISLFEKAYLQHKNLTDATRYLANELFSEYGLVILDGDDKNLKKVFAPFVKEDLINQTCFKEVTKTNLEFQKNYKIQVNPREINMFYLEDNLRERIVFEDGKYKINNTDTSFSEAEILNQVDNFPEKFSPNVMMRPLYEEVVLPNLCYIGGGGEIAYWMELKSFFESQKIVFPILLLRNSVLFISKKQFSKLEKLGVSLEEVFLKKSDFINKKVKEISDISIDFSEQRKTIRNIFNHLEEISNCTDKSFLGAVKAQEKKQLNGLDYLEKRLLKAQKRKLNDVVERISILHHQLFPNDGLQERIDNFSSYYEGVGDELIKSLIKNLDPLKLEFDIIKI